MSYFTSYTNNTQAAAAGYNSMSNGATYQAPAYGTYQQQQPVAAATTPGTAYIASSNQQTAVPTQYALSYAQPQQAQQTAVATGNPVANTAQQQTSLYQQPSYYSSPAPATPAAQFSKPASYYHQSPQQNQYYNTGTVVMKEATQPQQQSYTVESSTYTNNMATQQQQQQKIMSSSPANVQQQQFIKSEDMYSFEKMRSSYAKQFQINQTSSIKEEKDAQGFATPKQLTKTSLMTQGGAVTAAAPVVNTAAAGVVASAMQVMKPPQPPATTTHHQQQQQHRVATQQHHTMTSQQNHHQLHNQVHHNTTQQSHQQHQQKMLHQLYHQQQQGGHHHHHQQQGHHQQGPQRQAPYAQLGNLPYWKQKRMIAQQSKDPNKPIQASEIKAYLYAWLGRYRSRPDYTITPHSLTTSRIMYVAELIATGYAYIGKGCAGNKKDAQTRAAWDFCDYLVRESKMNKKDLPTREAKFEEAKNRIPSNYKPIHYKPDDELNRVAVYAEAAEVEITSKPTKKAAKQQQQKPKVEMSASDKEAVAKAEAIMTSSEGNAVVVKPLMSIEVQPSNKGAAAPAGDHNEDICDSMEESEASKTDENSDSKQGSVGESYVEQIWTDGRVVRYRCNLCECEFNDLNTKESHVRGRRHRLNYKQKVDPTIVVEIKLNQKQKTLMMQRMQAEKKNREHVMEVKKHREWRLHRQDEMSRAYEEDMMRHQYLRGNGAPPHMAPPPLMYDEYRRRGMPPPHMRSPHGGAKFHQQKFSPRFTAMKAKDDELVMMKHNQIYPKEEELSAVQKLVQIVESSLKQVSEKIHEEEMIVFTASSLHNQTRPAPERLLKSVLRIGSLAKGLLLHANLNCELVLVCKEKPTFGMLKRVAGILPSQLQTRCEEMKIDPSEYVMEVKDGADEIVVKSTSKSSPQVVCNIHLTSPVMRQTPAPVVAPKPIETAAAAVESGIEQSAVTASDEKEDCKTDDSATAAQVVAVMPSKNPPDMLERKKCCQLLASLRHVKWFQLRASGLQSCVIVIRLMKDFCTRVPTWRPLSSWAIELLVQTVISSSIEQVAPYMGMLLVFKAISSGILLEDGPGLLDPCERERSDVVDYLSLQQREDITSSAQHALRLMAFGSTFEVLGLDEPVIEVNNNNGQQSASPQARKRPLEQEEDSNKKAKIN